MARLKAKNYLTPKDTAAYLKVSTETVRQWAKSGRLKAETTLGGHRRFCIEEVERFSDYMQFKRKSVSDIRVLIVDDDKQYVRYVEELLKTFSEEIKVEKAYDGFEAGHKVDTFKPTIVILDLIMPSINGIEVCRYLKNNEQTKNIRIIATTGYASDINTHNFLNAGAELVLEKPIEVNLLQEFIMSDNILSI